MKTTNRIIFGFLVIGLTVFSISVEKDRKSANTDFSSVNIQALQAEAQVYRSYCSCDNTLMCNSGGFLSTGRLVTED